MKQLLLALLLAAILYSCGSDTVTDNITNPPEPTDTTLLFSKDSLICDFHDSVYQSGSFVFSDVASVLITGNYKSISLSATCTTNINSMSSIVNFGLQKDSTQISAHDTVVFFYGNSINNTFKILLTNSYGNSQSFFAYMNAGLLNNPLHTSLTSITNLKIFGYNQISTQVLLTNPSENEKSVKEHSQ